MENVRKVVETNNIKQQKILTEESKFYTFAKRSMDLTISVVSFIFLMPLLILISLLYLLEKKKGNVIFKQRRVGKNGEFFNIYKFRSMAVDAESRLTQDKKLYQKYIDNNYKLEPDEDPRITKLGSFLRKTSLDELPQLINVIKGDMSLVGPRPVVEQELVEYEDKVRQFLSVKPGVTGYWQISGRSNIKYPERVGVELHYVHNRSLSFDIEILFKTFISVLFRKGAY
ncbi:sugar transferase [Shouchella sp. JSM 1781072]|uniref:sugar transferase n=1 Tax=Shouchella sp. JSM 1781072 TaxID=3344581 RepID=UPI0035C25923